MARYIVFDVETPNARNDRISAIGITVVEDRAITDSFYTLVNPETAFDPFNIRLTGISPEQVKTAPDFPALWRKIEPILSSGIPVAHNARFDLGVLQKCLAHYGLFWKEKTLYLCTVQIGRRLLPGMSHQLNVLTEHYQIPLNHHRADSDSRACAEILLRYLAQEGSLDRFLRTYSFGKVRPLGPQDMDRKSRTMEMAGKEGTEMEAARECLRSVYGYQDFRAGQAELVKGILQGQDVLGVMPTGSGKSVCYQIPALLLPGTTLVISPLISLMKDQVAALKSRGIPAACMHSNLEEGEYEQTVQQLLRGTCRILYAAPERLAAPGFAALCGRISIPFVAVDEAHCVSQWGQDFRPSYLKIPEFLSQLQARPVLGAFTATATPRVKEDILRDLGLRDPVCVSTGFDRPNLSFSVYQPADRDRTLTELLRDRFRQSGIVYCATRKNVEAVCDRLQQEGFEATRYHAGLSAEERVKNQEDFLYDRRRVMVATNAFGMGIDKSNVSYVIHYNMPKSLEAYYQEAGRAGRDGCDADCILLYSGQDVMMARWLIEHEEPNPDLTPEKQQEVREKEEERLKRMTFYARSSRCLRGDILRYFGEKPPEKCGNCSNCVPNCEHRDITVEAQMILSCIARTEQRLPRETLAQLLRGEVPPELPEGILPEKLSTFGLMKEVSQWVLLGEMQALCDQGIADPAPEDPRVLRLNALSKEVLFQGRRVTMRLLREKTESGPEMSEDLFQALQRLRYEISAKEMTAASILFSDGTLREICRKLPRDEKQLAAVDGMGIYKAARYGERILALVDRFAPREGGEKTKTPVKAKKKRTFAEYLETLQTDGKTGAYQSWSEEEDQQLRREMQEGLTVAQMAEVHKRTRGAIRSRIKKQEAEGQKEED